LDQLADDMAQAVDLLLARNVAVGAAGELDVLLPAHHLPDRIGCIALRVPKLHGEDQRVAARVVVEHGFDRRVGVDAAVPKELIADAHRRKRRRQRARGHDVLHAQRLVAAVEVAHRAAGGIDGAHRQARGPARDAIEVDVLAQRLGQRRRVVVGGALGAQRGLRAPQQRAPRHFRRRHERRPRGRPVRAALQRRRSSTTSDR
jgi:hypothetical protein